MKNQPTQVAGEAQENTNAAAQAAIEGTSRIVEAFLQRPTATLAETKDLISHVGQTFSAFITTSPIAPKSKPGPKPGNRRAVTPPGGDVTDALKAAIAQVDPKSKKNGAETTSSAKKKPGPKPKAKATKKVKGKLKRGKPTGQYAEIIEQFEDYEDAGLTPAVAIKDSITPTAIISLHTGKPITMMKSHLYHLGYRDTDTQTAGDRYREFWKLPKDYPLVTQEYSERRKDLAKKMITGRRPGAKTLLDRASKAKDRHEYLVKHTVFPNYIISLIDGSPQKILDLHVENNKMTWDDYLKKFDLPADYPKSAESVGKAQDDMRERQGLRTGTGG